MAERRSQHHRSEPRRFRRPRLPAATIWFALLLLVLFRVWSGGADSAPTAPLAEGNYAVERVIDGDTLLVQGNHTVRLMGVDTPESVKPEHPVERWGPEATAFTREFIAGRQVRLRFDRERVDQYGRLLAYVWVEERLLNEELVRAGFARFEPQYHYAEPMKRRFRSAQDEARSAQRGIWSDANSLVKPAAAR
jgi:micrococcal nuclease